MYLKDWYLSKILFGQKKQNNTIVLVLVFPSFFQAIFLFLKKKSEVKWWMKWRHQTQVDLEKSC